LYAKHFEENSRWSFVMIRIHADARFEYESGVDMPYWVCRMEGCEFASEKKSSWRPTRCCTSLPSLLQVSLSAGTRHMMPNRMEGEKENLRNPFTVTLFTSDLIQGAVVLYSALPYYFITSTVKSYFFLYMFLLLTL